MIAFALQFCRSLPWTAPSGRSLRSVGPLAWVALMLALLIAGAAAIQIRALHEEAVRNTHKSLTSLAAVLADQADRAIQAIELIQDAVTGEVLDDTIASQADYVAKATTHALHESLEKRIAALPQINAVTLIDRNGKLLNFSRYWPIPDVNISDRDYFKALSADSKRQRYVSRPVPNRGDGAWTIYVARRLSLPDGTFLGLILGAVELRYFETLYGQIAPEPNDVISMFRTDGVLLARHPSLPEEIGKAFPAAGAVRILAQDASGTGVVK